LLLLRTAWVRGPSLQAPQQVAPVAVLVEC
jgi:hypothetical protein